MAAGVTTGAIRGREAELGHIAAFLERPPDGFAALLIEGEAGIGKTTLWQAAVGAAREQAWTVLSCRAAESEAVLPFAGLSDLIEPVLDDALPQLPDAQREALEAALARIDTAPAGAREFAVAAATLGVLRAVTATGRTLLALDDVQWLDRPSARALAFSLRRLREPVALVATRRTGAEMSSVELEKSLTGIDPERIHVKPLTVGALAGMLRDEFELELPRVRLAALHRATGGNPLYAREIIRESLRQGSVDELRVPRPLLELLRERIHAASPAAKRLLLLVSELGDARLSILEGLDVPEEAFGEVLARDLGERDGERFRFTHPLLGSALRADTPESALGDVHRFLAERLDDEVERALHLALATPEPDERIAAQLERAASSAGRRGAHETAAILAEHAVRVTAEAGEPRWRRMIEAENHHWRIGDIERARSLLHDILEGVEPGLLRARALLHLAIVSEGDPAGALEHATAALEQPGIPDDLRAEIEMWRAMLNAYQGRLDEAVMALDSAQDAATAAGDDWVLAHAVCTTLKLAFLRGQPVAHDRLDWTVEVEESVPPRPRGYWASPHIERGRIRRAEGDVDGARSDFEREMERRREVPGDEFAQILCRIELVVIELAAGDVHAAAEHAATAVELAEPVTGMWFRPGSHAAHALADAYIGNVDRARAHAEEALAARSLPNVEISARGALGLLALSLGDAAGARAHLAGLPEIAWRSGVQHPGLYTFWGDLIEAYVALGHLDDAERLLLWLEERGSSLDHAWSLAVGARCRALLLAGKGEIEPALAATGRALDLHDRLDPHYPLERGRTLLVRGTVLRRVKRRREAREALEQAADVFERLPAPLWLERARGELARVAPRHGDRFELTPTEKRVAQLAATGARNREIAEQLFMSVKTVEGNLSRIYGKLGVRSRTELANRMSTPID